VADSRTAPPVPPKVTDVLEALPAKELKALAERLGLRIDAAKRLDPPSQVARALCSLPELKDTRRLQPASQELLLRIANAGGILSVSVLPPGLEPLLARGVVFARGRKGDFQLLLPIAHFLQLRPWDGEAPRAMRALLAQTTLEAQNTIAANYLGRPAAPPVVLGLEYAWETLGDEERLAAEVKKLPATERKLLDAIEQEGGEVYTDELLELEREPLRLRTAIGATQTRRGVGFSLERRGFLIPLHPNRHVIPAELSRIISASDHDAREQKRAELKAFVADEDHAPRRARFARDAGVLAMALAVANRETGTEVRAGIGTPKSLVQKLSLRLGADVTHVALLVSLSRSLGLWDQAAMQTHLPPGSLTLGELPALLFEQWRRGGIWDEGRPEAETLRLAAEARDASAANVVRTMVLEALADLGDDRWIPWNSLAGYLREDPRMAGLVRLFRRWSERVGLEEAATPFAVAARIVQESLPALGVLDLGDADGEGGELAVRVTPRGRKLIAGIVNAEDAPKSKFLDSHVLRLGPEAIVANVLALSPFVELGKVQDTVDLIIAPQTLARALSAGFEADALRLRIEEIAKLPETLSRTLAAASVVVGRGEFVAASGILWVEDASVRELLRTRKATHDLFVDPSPNGTLVVHAGVDLEKLVRRARTVGVEIVGEGAVLKVRTTPPPQARTTPHGGTRTVSATVAKVTTQHGKIAK
jgi:hypothetical protein